MQFDYLAGHRVLVFGDVAARDRGSQVEVKEAVIAGGGTLATCDFASQVEGDVTHVVVSLGVG